MIKLLNQGAYVFEGKTAIPASEAESPVSVYRDMDGQPLTQLSRTNAAKQTLTYKILSGHDEQPGSGQLRSLRLKFDCLASHDITYVGIIQTLRAVREDMRFPVPYVLSNCHNSLCAVGGTINSDDHAFGLSAAKKYGGVFVPPHIAVIHQYIREMMTGGGRMILGSDSHTRYGALGTMGFGEGGGELVKQLLGRAYEIPYPEVVGVCLTGAPRPGVGPQDVALAIIGAVFDNGYVKNKVMEFFGEGVSGLSVDFRNGIDVMTTETACLSSIWMTDDKVEAFYQLHGRAADFRSLMPGEAAYYDGLIEVDLSTVKPMIALPFHPSHVYEIETLQKHAGEIAEAMEKNPSAGFSLKDKLINGEIHFDQGIIAGCAGGLYENIRAAAGILADDGTGNGPFSLSIYPASQPVYLAMTENGVAASLIKSGAVIKTAFCGPCFGAGDVPVNNGLSARHTTRNFPNREGSKPDKGQSAGVALMDARSIAATAKNGGRLTAASEADRPDSKPDGKPYFFDGSLYEKRVYNGFDKRDKNVPLVLGPGIRDWPALSGLTDHLLLTVAAFITDPVTTTDELIPSGETSSYRSNPQMLAEFTLSRKDPAYVSRAKAVHDAEQKRLAEAKEGLAGRDSLILDNIFSAVPYMKDAFALINRNFPIDLTQTALGSLVYALKPGDGSAREQAASCQRVLGGLANIAREYATKRYRSNLVNWGMLPFVLEDTPLFETGDCIFIPGLRRAVENGHAEVTAYVVKDALTPFTLSLKGLTKSEAEIILHGGLINYYRADMM